MRRTIEITTDSGKDFEVTFLVWASKYDYSFDDIQILDLEAEEYLEESDLSSEDLEYVNTKIDEYCQDHYSEIYYSSDRPRFGYNYV